MKRSGIRIISAIAVLIMVVTVFSACDMNSILGTKEEIPTVATLKTDLNDPAFTFTYGELKGVIPQDKLASLFENYDEKHEDTEITLSYNDITSRFNGETLADIWSLLTAEELAKTTANSDQALEYFNNLINGTKAAMPITKYDEEIYVPNGKETVKDKDGNAVKNENGEEIETETIRFFKDGAEIDQKSDTYKTLKGSAVIFKDYVLKGVNTDDNDKKVLLKGTTKKGEDLTNILYLHGSDKASLLTKDDIVSAISSVKVETTTVKKIDYVTGYTRTILITLKADEASVNKAFSTRNKAPILEEMKKAGSYFDIEDYSITFNTCTIAVVIDASTDEITSVTYTKNMKVNSSVKCVGDLANLGEMDVQFNCTNTMKYDFGWKAE